jgi:hypothetical protein
VAERTAQAMIASSPPPRRATAFAKMALFRGETTELETCLEYERIAHVWDARPPTAGL